MGKYIKVFKTHTEYNTYAQSGDIVKPNVSYCKDNKDVHYNPWTYAEAYLTFVALEDGTFQLSRNAVSYSLDNGETWTELAAATASPTVTAGNKIMWKGTITPTSYPQGIGKFSATGNFDVQGNPMSLLFGDDFKGQTDLAGKYFTFHSLFHQNTKVVNAKNLSLPATTLANGCYTHMFNGCTSLVTAPVLSATTLAESCYYGMFNGCTSLTTAPELPATTLAENCYREMFYGCTSLTMAPELPAATLTRRCYSCMFYGCTSLTTVPSVLPATTLATYCCEDMFQGCTSLTTAPVLPATTLADYCYTGMFNGCANLNYIKAMFTTTPSNSYTSSWVSGVASTGTFVKNSAATWDVTGNNGVPTGWTVQTASK